MADLISTVKTMEKEGDKTVVTVEVVGPKITPEFIKELRARARALLATGPTATTVDVVTDVTVGEINRFTEVRTGPLREDEIPLVTPRGGLSGMLEAVVYVVEVNRHGGRWDMEEY